MEPAKQEPKRKSQEFVPLPSEDDDIVLIEDKELLAKQAKFHSLDWLKKFSPKTVEDLTIHPKKFEDLKNWFEIQQNIKEDGNKNKILLLIGPTGCSKTLCLKLLAKEQYSYDIVEWFNTTDLESDLLNDNEYKSSFSSYESQITKFSDFLLKASRYGSIFNNKKRIILVKDLPNTFLKKTDEFWEILTKYTCEGSAPIVFIITEFTSKSLNIAYNLFPDKIRNDLRMDVINFNPISVTLLKKGLKRICGVIESNKDYKMCFNKPPDETIDEIIDQCQGDIRNAIMNLNFASQKSAYKIGGSLPPINKKPKKGRKSKIEPKTGKANSGGGIGKNENLTVMHGLGRVFNPKYELNQESKKQELTHKPEIITESFRTHPSKFIHMIYSNYIKNFTDINDIAEMSSFMAISDNFMYEYRDEKIHDLNLNLVIRAAMVCNKSPKPGMTAIGAYANKKFISNETKMEELYIKQSKDLNNGNMVARIDFFSDYKYFLNILKP